MGVLPGWWLGESDGRAEVSTLLRFGNHHPTFVRLLLGLLEICFDLTLYQ